MLDLGVKRPIHCVAALGVNRGPSSRASADLVVATGSSLGGPWTPTVLSLPADAGVPALPRHIIGTVAVSTQYMRITPGWAVPPGVTYRELGRLFLGPLLALSKGPSEGWGFTVLDDGEVDVSDGRQAYEDARDHGRSLSIACANLSVQEAYGFSSTDSSGGDVPSIQDMLMTVGATGEVIAIHRMDSPLWIARTAIYGRLTKDSLRIQHVAGDTYRWDATLIEEY